MAKTGFWLRGAKGKLAGTSLYRGRTGTVQREIVTPTNPKTINMMLQRALFAEVAKFYSNGQKNLFKFAFENKSTNQTDFNAFMAENVKRGFFLPQSVVKGGGYPMLGLNFVLTRGSLPRVGCYNVDADTQEHDVRFISMIETGATTSQLATIAQVSQELVAAGYQEGDIITILAITSPVRYDRTAPSNGYMTTNVENNPPTWVIKQFIVNTADDRSTAVAGISVSATDVYDMNDEKHVLAFTVVGANVPNYEHEYDNSLYGAAVTVSRNEASGLKVSTTYLATSAGAWSLMYQVGNNSPYTHESYMKLVADSWGAKGDAVLQGSLANRVQAVTESAVPTSVQGAASTMHFADDMQPSSVGGSVEEDIEVGSSFWIKVNGSGWGAARFEDFSLSVASNVGVIENVLHGKDCVYIKVAAKAQTANVSVRCSKSTEELLCKVSFT